MNERIRITPIRLIDETGEMVGIVETDEARRRAADAGLDLVEVAADVRPPVCRIMDYGKFRYEQSKKDRAGRAKSKVSEMKEVRLGRSMKIDPHDVEIRINQARRFLAEGHRVQIVQNFRGAREMAHRDRGDVRMQEVIERLSDLAKVEAPPRMAGRRMSMILVPDRAKVEAYKRRIAAEKAARGESVEEEVEEIEEAATTTTADGRLGERLQIPVAASHGESDGSSPSGGIDDDLGEDFDDEDDDDGEGDDGDERA
ncbi:MAG: translation initiation factor IF-3 [Phycisphaerales bacterium]|jgi:translation initiation factor IF-3